MGSCILTQNHLGHQLVRGKQPLVLVSDWFGRGLFFLEWLCRVESHQFRMSQILYHRIYYRNGIQVVIEYGVQLAIIVVITIITPFDGVDPNTNAPTPHRSIKPALPHSLTTVIRGFLTLDPKTAFQGNNPIDHPLQIHVKHWWSVCEGERE